MRTSEVARVLGVTRTRVQQMADEGTLTATRDAFNNRVFNAEQVRKVAAERQQRSAKSSA